MFVCECDVSVCVWCVCDVCVLTPPPCFLSDPVVQCVAVELQRPLQASFTLDLHDGVRVLHHLDETDTVADGQTAIRQHSAHTHTELASCDWWMCASGGL